MKDGSTRGWMIATLVCAVFMAAAAVVITILAVSGSGQASGSTGQAEGGLQQRNQVSQAAGGEAKPSGSSGTTQNQAGGKSGGGNQNPGNNQPSNPPVATNPPIVTTPIPVTSLEEGLLNQAALDYVKGIAGATQGYRILETKISQFDPEWGRVIILNEGKGLTSTSYFHKQGGKWAPANSGTGTPAAPADI